MAAPNKKGEALPPLSAVLTTLEQRRKKLDEADTRLSELIKEAEACLQDHVKTRVSADITRDSDPAGTDTRLIFGKHDGKWQLLIEILGFGEDSLTPLLSCSREMRVRVFTGGGLESLIRGAAEQLDAQLAEREDALDKAAKLVSELGGVPF